MGKLLHPGIALNRYFKPVAVLIALSFRVPTRVTDYRETDSLQGRDEGSALDQKRRIVQQQGIPCGEEDRYGFVLADRKRSDLPSMDANGRGASMQTIVDAELARYAKRLPAANARLRQSQPVRWAVVV